MVFRKIKNLLGLMLSFACVSTTTAYAWEHEVSVGYGSGTELEQDYTNSGFELGGVLYKFPNLDRTLIATINGTLGQWHADTADYRNLTTAAVSLGLRGYAVYPDQHRFRPYVGVTFGPAYLSQQQFGEEVQGTNFAFQAQLGVGTEIGDHQHSWDLNFHLDHYSNAGLFPPNEGINILYMFSLGYQF